MSTLTKLQNSVKIPKTHENTISCYTYRTLDDIIIAIKPLLDELEASITLTDQVVAAGNNIYIVATATLTDSEGNSWQTSAAAREPIAKKGMDPAQITGACSTYARKYALAGLLLLDSAQPDIDASINQYSDINDINTNICYDDVLEYEQSSQPTPANTSEPTDNDAKTTLTTQQKDANDDFDEDKILDLLKQL